MIIIFIEGEGRKDLNFLIITESRSCRGHRSHIVKGASGSAGLDFDRLAASGTVTKTET